MANSALRSESSQIELSPELFRKLIDAARHAPSPDNNQPWCFRLENSQIQVFHVRQRALPSDIDDFFSWQAIGPAIENIVLTATTEQLIANVQYHPRPFAESADGELIATIGFTSGGEPDLLAKFIEQRATNRRLYEKPPLPATQTASLASSIQDSHSSISWLTSAAELKALGKLVYLSDRIRFEHQPFHEEFHKVLRYTDAEAKATGDGLDLKTLEIPPPAVPLFRWLRPWKRMKLANRFGMSGMFAGNSQKQVQRSGAVGLLMTCASSDEHYLQAGRSLQRLWLACTSAGLAFQPMGGLPMFLTRFAREGRQAFLDEHADKIASIVEPFYELFPAASENTLVMLFRIGKADPPSARSYRYPLERIIAGNET